MTTTDNPPFQIPVLLFFSQSYFTLSVHFYPCPSLCCSFTWCSPWPEPGREPLGR